MHGQLDVVKDSDTCVPTYRLQSGDSVVLEAHQLLTSVHMHSNHFALMRTVQDSKPPITDSAWTSTCCVPIVAAQHLVLTSWLLVDASSED